MSELRKLPSWLKRRIGDYGKYSETSGKLGELGIETICSHANCPNRGECWGRGTASVLILGSVCTRNCRFCSVMSGRPEAVDGSEAERVARMVNEMGVKYLVITSVDRDDLADGGAGHFRDVVLRCREVNAGTKYEILTPDFKGVQDEAVKVLGEARPFVFSHNIEVVRRIHGVAKPGSDYDRSLELLAKAKEAWQGGEVKSSMMLGLGERDDEVVEPLGDWRRCGVGRVSLGQYLRPSRECMEVGEYVRPEKFEYWGEVARDMGFSWVMSSPYTRSSYHAEQEA